MTNALKPWIGVDLDGTLAEYHGWQGIDHIGDPIKPMQDRVKGWLAEGIKVKIFTARASEPDAEALKAVISYIEEWCEEHLGQKLEVTCKKDFAMTDLYDDRCHRVEVNTGKILA